MIFQMWSLFTAALARGHSTTQVSILNTSTNFFITAILGFAIFSEALPPLWWVGATLLVAGNVIVGQKNESSDGNSNVNRSEAISNRSRAGTVLEPVNEEDEDVDEDDDDKDGRDELDEEVIDLGKSSSESDDE
jgi:hypothetical protein